MLLSELKTGESAVVVKVKGYGAFRKRLNEMGFVRGKEVKAVKNAPLNDPIEYAIMGYAVSLRRREAAFIEVVSIEAEAERVGPSAEMTEVVEAFASRWKERDNTITVAFVGNPNAGKTTLFNYVSGSSEHVGNYGGVTVDAKEAHFRFEGYRFNVVDLPGTYSLTAYSSEERYVRDYIVNHAPDVILNVVDASNLERNLYLTTQLIDLDVQTIIALNMFDELTGSGATLNYQELGRMIGMPVVPTVAAKGKGVKELLREIIRMYEGTCTTSRHVRIHYGEDIEQGIERIGRELNLEPDLSDNLSPRFLSLKLLEGDRQAIRFVTHDHPHPELDKVYRQESERIEAIYGEPVEAVVTDAKYGFIAGALKETYTEPPVGRHRKTTHIDALLTHKIWGFPFFFLFLFVTFFATFSLGKYPMEWIESGVGLLGDWVSDRMAGGMLKDLLVDGIIGGVGGVIVFLPNILILFLFISFMEDTGYMARAAFIMDKLMHKIGLHGKSFIPLIMGFGCNVPAIMATRTLENRNDRILTILINPFMSCSARLPVYILFIGAFFPKYPALVLFGIYLLGVLTAVVMGRLFKRVLFHQKEAPFVMELPPYRMPTLRTTLIHMWNKGQQYLKKMGGIIMLASVLIWALGYFPVNDRLTADFEEQRRELETKSVPGAVSEERLVELNRQEAMARQEYSYIGRIGRWMEPVWVPLGLDWRAGVSLLTGVAAKEVVVSTMGVLYLGDGTEAETATLSSRLKEWGYTPGLALVLMVFVLLYAPCFATVIAIGKEIGVKWGLFVMGYTTVLAWVVSFLLHRVLLLSGVV